MAAGLGVLRLEPRAFWSMTPKELEAALRGIAGPAAVERPLARHDLDTLIEKFPDGRVAG